MTKVYVLRNDDKIVGWFAAPQVDFPELEEMDLKDPEVIAFNEKVDQTVTQETE